MIHQYYCMSHCYDNYEYPEYTHCYLKNQYTQFQISYSHWNKILSKTKQSSKNNFSKKEKYIHFPIKNKNSIHYNTWWLVPTCTCHSVSRISSVASTSKWSIRITACRIAMTVMSTKSTLIVIWKISIHKFKFHSSSASILHDTITNQQGSQKSLQIYEI